MATMPGPVAVPQRRTSRCRVASHPTECRRVWERVVHEVRRAGFSPRCEQAIGQSVLEAITNAHRHGNGEDPAKAIELTWWFEKDGFGIEIRDEGPGFDPDLVPDPTTPAGLLKESGRGLAIMRHLMDEVRFSGNGSCVSMRRLRTGGPP